MPSEIVQSLAASIVSNKAYIDLKSACYESSASKKSHEAIVTLFQELEAWAREAPEKNPLSSPKGKKPKQVSQTDPDLDESLTEEELALRK